MAETDSGFGVADAEGFRPWLAPDRGRFIRIFDDVRVRVEGPAVVRVRVGIGMTEANIGDNIHGGFILAFVDQAPFCATFVLGRLPPGGAVTLSASATFIGPGRIDRPLDAVVEIIGETGRMLFLRGMMEQEGRPVASFEATLRKTSRPAIAAGAVPAAATA